jgi:hypothetical protein
MLHSAALDVLCSPCLQLKRSYRLNTSNLSPPRAQIFNFLHLQEGYLIERKKGQRKVLKCGSKIVLVFI